MSKIVFEQLLQLSEALDTLLKTIHDFPSNKLRFKDFLVTTGPEGEQVLWPCQPHLTSNCRSYVAKITQLLVVCDNRSDIYLSLTRGHGSGLWDVAAELVSINEADPRKVLRSVRRLQLMINWCKNRIDGLKRAAINRAKQQEKWILGLEGEQIVMALSGGSTK